jgi:hypothetical protein
MTSKVPVIVGVGDYKNRSQKVEDALEPAELMLRAIDIALKDSNISDPKKLQSQVDSIDVVLTWTWPYPDLPGLLAQKLGVTAQHKFVSPHGGNQPAKLFDEAARRIAKGKNKVAVVTGGEALASCMRYHAIYNALLLTAFSKRMCSCEKASTSRMDEASARCGQCIFANEQRPRRW